MKKYTAIFLSVLGMGLLYFSFARAGSMTLTTYYPAPTGYYSAMTVDQQTNLKSTATAPTCPASGVYHVLYVDSATNSLKGVSCSNGTKGTAYPIHTGL